VLQLCAEFPKRFKGRARYETFGTTPEGRPMVALIASDDGVLDDKAAAAKQRPVVLLQGGIHAGEIDGKDAGLRLLRGLLEGKLLPGALKAVTVVLVPVFNVDGHERFGPNHRPNQRGPEEMGFRVTAQNLNLNRDYLKAEAPEMQALLSLLHRYDPVLYADLHVTDGARFQHDVSVLIEPYHAGLPALRALGAAVHDSIFPALTAQGHLPLDFYPSFVKDDDPTSGFEAGIPSPRFSHTYWSIQNRFAVLVETHAWKDYRARVQATFDVCVALLQEAAAHGKQWRRESRGMGLWGGPPPRPRRRSAMCWVGRPARPPCPSPSRATRTRASPRA
jgi:Zinc carboxypeptidase